MGETFHQLLLKHGTPGNSKHVRLSCGNDHLKKTSSVSGGKNAIQYSISLSEYGIYLYTPASGDHSISHPAQSIWNLECASQFCQTSKASCLLLFILACSPSGICQVERFRRGHLHNVAPSGVTQQHQDGHLRYGSINHS